ncbi:MAG: heavy metal translocating P-type ATPase [Blautia sp.]|nr:heavy metal translocating P-type ATPase [Blautia sp.]
MDQYTVTGMSCAACQARVEKAVSKVPGVESCSVSLLTNSMGVEGTASPADIIRAVTEAGYGAKQKGESGKNAGAAARIAEQEEALKDHETPVLRRRLFTSLGFLLILMYFSMGHMMLGLPLPAFFDDNHVAVGLAELILAAIVMVINQKFFTSGFRSLFHAAPNMDTLIALGSAAAFVYSTIMLFAMTRAQADHDMAAVMRYMMEFYFESAAMILTLITVGKMLEAYSKGKTTNALKSLMKLAPKTAAVERDGMEVTVSIDEVEKGDIFFVRPGENIPVDGVVIEGCSAVNEAALTGESIPVDKAPGDAVSSATLNQSGFLKCEATRVGEDTTLSQIIAMVSDAAATKAPVAKLADRISGVFVPAVILIALITTVIWLLAGRPAGFALARGICVLVVSCPCALGLATPVAIMVGNGVGARNGILFKNAEALQEAGNVQIIALDKTGTITKGEPEVTELIPAETSSEEELLTVAFALEKKSEHPLAKSVLRYAGERGQSGPEADEFMALVGNGLQAKLDGQSVYGGSEAFLSGIIRIPQKEKAVIARLSEEGKTPLLFAKEERFLGVIAVADQIKEDSAQAISELRQMGIYVVMLTGDNARTAGAIGKTAGVDEVVAGVLPDGKENVIRRLAEYGKVAMVGDGINDAPALTRADIGIAIGAGTDVAIDAADVVLMKSTLADVPAAIRLSRRTYKNILENLFWALIYNTLLIPAAAGAYVNLFGLTMNPMLGAAAMSLSSFCVVTNALRLNLTDIYDSSGDRKRKNALVPEGGKKLLGGAEEKTTEGLSERKGEIMNKTLKIEGMMCPHCEATVKKALEAIDQVQEAVVSHEAGTAVVTLSGEVDDAVLTKAVEDKDYKVTGIA